MTRVRTISDPRCSPINEQYLILPLKLMISFAVIYRLKKKEKKKKEGKEEKEKPTLLEKRKKEEHETKVGQKKAEQKFAVA